MNYYQIQQMAIDEIKAHKSKVERIADEKLLSALEIEEIKELYDNIKDMKRDIAVMELEGKDIAKQSDKVEKTREKLLKLLKKNNFNVADFVPKYWCKECKDTGMKGNGICDCVNARATSNIMSVDGSREVEASFDNVNYDIFDNPDYMRQVYDRAKKFVEKIDITKYNNFTILGGVGVGKTHLMECMANFALDNHRYVIYLSAFKLNQTFLNYHTANMAEKNSIIAPLLECEMLCIDDLGCEQMLNNVTIPMLIMLINERNLASKKTVITSNLTLDEIRERYDYRLCSRLLDNNVSLTIMIDGRDLRQKNLKQG
ncbi:MAG: hypothetical protein E7361_01685 [Clostridiales bacterium]|nr:hypothetical protein [Clostridiales bacterium]